MTLPTAPVDGAASKVVLEYIINGKKRHIGLHLMQLDTANPTTRGTPALPDWSYTNSESFLGITLATTELGVQDTVTAFLNAGVKHLYPSAVNFAIKSVFANSGGVLTELFPTAAVGAEAGLTDADAFDAASPENLVASILTCRTTNGGRWRLQLIGAGNNPVAKPIAVPPSSTGTDYQKLANYLLSSACRILGHDGGKLTGNFTLHQTSLTRLRRGAGF